MMTYIREYQPKKIIEFLCKINHKRKIKLAGQEIGNDIFNI